MSSISKLLRETEYATNANLNATHIEVYKYMRIIKTEYANQRPLIISGSNFRPKHTKKL